MTLFVEHVAAFDGVKIFELAWNGIKSIWRQVDALNDEIDKIWRAIPEVNPSGPLDNELDER